MTPDEEHSGDEHLGEGEAPSLRDSLSEAFEAARGDGQGAEGAPAAPGADSEATPASAPVAPRADSRDANGRFAARPHPNPSRTPAAPEADSARSSGEAQPIQPPASWSAPAKAAFSSLPPIVQSEIAKREADVNRGFEDRAAALKRYEPLEQILQPRREMLAARGVSDVDFVKTLFAASDWIDRDPVSALRELMRQKGVTPHHLGVQAHPGQQPPHAAQLSPAVQTLAQQVQHLQTQLSQRDQAERAQRLQSFKSEIDAFAADPANTYFHNVSEDMVGLLQSGRANALQDAYDKADQCKTLRQLIARWAPPSENDTGSYVAAVSRACGLGPDQPVAVRQAAVMTPLVEAIIRHETGEQPYPPALIAKALSRAGIGPTPQPLHPAPSAPPPSAPAPIEIQPA